MTRIMLVITCLLYFPACDSGGEEQDASLPEDADSSDSAADADADADEEESTTCSSDRECGDGVFCNGEELCAPGDAAADELGCLPSSGDPCDEPSTCVEEGEGRCATPCEIDDDVDGDGHAARECDGDDCDDNDPARYPGNVEVCAPDGDLPDTHDEDCDPTTFGPDGDGDGFVSTMCCNEDEDGETACGRDCDDTSSEVNPEAPESCNFVDDNCDGAIDEGVRDTYYPDGDGDGFGRDDGAVEDCSQPDGFTLDHGDCDDDDPARHPGLVDVCNGTDDDCDTDIDEDATFRTYYFDDDGDDYGDDDVSVEACEAPEDYVLSGGDCDDDDPARHPGLVDVCNGINDDCDEETDEDEPGITCYRDIDLDGFGNLDDTTMACSCDPGWTSTAGPFDCHDDDDDVFPGQVDYFTDSYTTRGGAESFDYNCNGEEEPLIDPTVRGHCTPRLRETCGGAGWTAGPPACGTTGTWATCIWIPDFIDPSTGRCVRSEADVTRTQECR